MDNKPDLIKIASLSLDKQGRLLIVKPKDKEVWISVGGKLEEGETEVECLKRELMEELNEEITTEPKFYCETPIEQAADGSGITVIVKFYLANVGHNLFPDGNEIENFKWISKKDFKDIKSGKSFRIGSGLEHYAIPKLIGDGLMN